MKHLIQEDLDIELSLQSVEDISFVLFVLRVEPTLGQIRLQEHRYSEVPYFGMVRNKVEHRIEVLLCPVMH